jgi:hypothetical protein
MSFKRRGLGRGLEALLVDVPPNEDRSVAAKTNVPDQELTDTDGVNKLAQTDEVTIRQECLAILAEALTLKELMNEIEQQVRAF